MAKAQSKPQAAAAKTKGKGGRKLLWWGGGLVIVLLGAAAAWYYLGQERLPSSRLKVIQDFLGKGRGSIEDTLRRARGGAEQLPGGAPLPEGAGGVRTHTVQEGENLWSIARQGALVDSPWEWRTILVQNRDKIDYTFLADENGGSWKVLVDKGKELTVRPTSPAEPAAGPMAKKYALQLASLPDTAFNRGVALVKTLLRDGYYAYLYRTEVNGQIYYRLRTGFYDTEAEAQDAGKEIMDRYTARHWFTDPFWVMVPSQAERRGERLDFGALRTKPWVIELSRRNTNDEALGDLKQAGKLGDLAYVMQGRDPASGRFAYRTRIGYFSTEAQAEAALKAQKGAVWDGAQVAQVDTFEEALPGQRFKLGKESTAARSAASSAMSTPRMPRASAKPSKPGRSTAPATPETGAATMPAAGSSAPASGEKSTGMAPAAPAAGSGMPASSGSTMAPEASKEASTAPAAPPAAEPPAPKPGTAVLTTPPPPPAGPVATPPAAPAN